MGTDGETDSENTAMKYANIIVNISHENLDKTFQYLVPDDLKDSIGVGDYVSIPFGKGNRIIGGYVLELTDKAEYDPSKLKEIAGITTDGRLIESRLIRLAYWMKSRYGSTMINALKTVLPVKKIIKEKEVRSIELTISKDEAREKLELSTARHHTARVRLLRELINEGQLDYGLVTGMKQGLPCKAACRSLKRPSTHLLRLWMQPP